MNKSAKIIISVGSNHDQQTHIDMARKFLCEAFHDVSFTEAIWTDPIGIVSDRYLNMLAVADTPTDEVATKAVLKKIESLCGDTRQLRSQNIVNMDLDLLSFGTEKRHISDCERPYIKKLMLCLDISSSLSHSC